MDQANELLTKQLTEEIRKLSTMEDGSDEKTATVNGINQMYRLKMENEKMEAEIKAQEAEREDNNRHKTIDHILNGVKIGGGFILFGAAYIAGLNFEKEGTITSKFFRDLTGKINPFK